MGTSTIHGGHEKMQLGENIIKLVMITPAARVLYFVVPVIFNMGNYHLIFQSPQLSSFIL